MTEKQIEWIKGKIKAIRNTVAAEKRKFGCYDDSRGIRYLPLQYYLQLHDFTGGLTYTRCSIKIFRMMVAFLNFYLSGRSFFLKTGRLRRRRKKRSRHFVPIPIFSTNSLGGPSFRLPNGKVPTWKFHLILNT
ncbi:MAG TPA: hypothetical protein VGG71_00450 [Chitinophagaceae bacterium]|jgi:hypothetical protein